MTQVGRLARHGRVHEPRTGARDARPTSAATSGRSAACSTRCSPACGHLTANDMAEVLGSSDAARARLARAARHVPAAVVGAERCLQKDPNLRMRDIADVRLRSKKPSAPPVPSPQPDLGASHARAIRGLGCRRACDDCRRHRDRPDPLAGPPLCARDSPADRDASNQRSSFVRDRPLTAAVWSSRPGRAAAQLWLRPPRVGGGAALDGYRRWAAVRSGRRTAVGRILCRVAC